MLSSFIINLINACCDFDLLSGNQRQIIIEIEGFDQHAVVILRQGLWDLLLSPYPIGSALSGQNLVSAEMATSPQPCYGIPIVIRDQVESPMAWRYVLTF